MLAMPALAQEDYPSRPVTMVVPFPPGGVADTVGRPVAEAMSRFLKQPVVVENKGGAGGGIGMGQVAKAKPDGYTVVMALSSFVVLPEADKLLKRTPMYQLDQLKPIARFTADPTVLVVRAESPWKTYAEFIAYVKSNPAKVSFGSSGNYGTMHVPMEQLKVATSSYMLHVPYTGAGPAVFALLAGQVDALSTGPASVLQQIKAGKLRALAHWG
ncbi:MAG: tripartite tricarboxylate transporter substrate binding protein, partial [Polaromonas sp.]|nr:tripartite tricarboxylate transporter substrate binding protein [Polaromonas sp.]